MRGRKIRTRRVRLCYGSPASCCCGDRCKKTRQINVVPRRLSRPPAAVSPRRRSSSITAGRPCFPGYDYPCCAEPISRRCSALMLWRSHLRGTRSCKTRRAPWVWTDAVILMVWLVHKVLLRWRTRTATPDKVRSFAVPEKPRRKNAPTQTEIKVKVRRNRMPAQHRHAARIGAPRANRRRDRRKRRHRAGNGTTSTRRGGEGHPYRPEF